MQNEGNRYRSSLITQSCKATFHVNMLICIIDPSGSTPIASVLATGEVEFWTFSIHIREVIIEGLLRAFLKAERDQARDRIP